MPLARIKVKLGIFFEVDVVLISRIQAFCEGVAPGCTQIQKGKKNLNGVYPNFRKWCMYIYFLKYIPSSPKITENMVNVKTV